MSQQVNDYSDTPAYPTPVAQPFGDGWLAVGGFTQRQRAAIDLRVPDSGTPWLDEMIRQSVRNEMAKHFISGLVSNPDFRTAIDDPNKIPDELSRLGLELADALLARIGGAK